MVAISMAVMALIFVVFTLVLILNTDVAVEANNGVVHSLFGIFALIFIALVTVNVWSAFSEREKIKQILLFKTKDSILNASVGVIRKLAKKAVAGIEHAKIKHIHLFVDSNNEVIMKAAIKIKADDEQEIKAGIVMDKVNKALTDEYKQALGFEFKTLELKLVSFKENKQTRPEPIQEKPTTKTKPEKPKQDTSPVTEDVISVEIENEAKQLVEA